MQITIEEIIKTPELKTRLVAGHQGITQKVNWAHVCEIPDPTEWLNQSDLLMTTGIGIPKNQKDQSAYILRLVEANVAGLMIGENMKAPVNLSKLFEIANQYNFPVLMTHYEVPFAAVTKLIIDSKNKYEFDRNRIISTLYEHARSGLGGLGTQELIYRLNKVIQANIYLVDLRTNHSFFSQSSILPTVILEQCETLKKINFKDLSLKKIKLSDFEYLYLLNTSFYGCKLLIHGGDLDYSLIHHIAAILSIDLERKNFEFQRKLRMGSELIDDILDQRIIPYQLQKKITEFGLDIAHANLMLVNVKEKDNFEQLFFFNQLPVIMKKQHYDYLFIVNTEDVQGISGLVELAGVSNAIGYVERFSNAMQEARLALKHTNHENRLQYYNNIMNTLPWLPKELDEAKQIVDRYLGELVKQDEKLGTMHMTTLKIYLEYNCSWEKSAKALNIHKQTLVYRIQKIQSITGRKVNCTESIAIFWFALKCYELCA